MKTGRKRTLDYSKDICQIDGCTDPYESLGLCRKHYQRLKQGKDPLMKGKYFDGSDESMFWQKASITANPNKCWEWQAALQGQGLYRYGAVWWKGKQRNAHTVAFEIANNTSIPRGMVVRHIVCRNPRCINPNHLALGTHTDNMRDKITDGTMPQGENHPKAKLTDTERSYIVKMLKLGAKGSDLAIQFNITESAISYHKYRESRLQAVHQQGATSYESK